MKRCCRSSIAYSRASAPRTIWRAARSTFMVEMTETAVILNTATARSLIVLDEIGRGTATYDGLALAWAVVEHIHEHLRAKTLFATHYHELTELEQQFEGVRNLHVSVKEAGDQIMFLRKVEPGAADRSYGIEVARLAALPMSVITRAQQILALHERTEHTLTEELTPRASGPVQIQLFEPVELRDCRSHPAYQRRRAASNRSTEAARGVAAGAKTAMRVAGIMSGTSLDGIDVAVVDIQGRKIDVVAHRTAPYPDKVRDQILAVSNTNTHTAEISRLNFLLPDLYAKAVRKCGVPLNSIELVGCHGQTVFHEPGSTLQLGDGSVLAEKLGIPVVSDFRTRDMAAGGKGAPLVPFVDYLLYADSQANRVALNIGGIANITVDPRRRWPGKRDRVRYRSGKHGDRPACRHPHAQAAQV